MVCVSSLQDVKLFNSNLDVVDEAFEYLVGKSSKEKSPYFTPRMWLICVKSINPLETETLIDTAAGSCGSCSLNILCFEPIMKDNGENEVVILRWENRRYSEYVKNKVFAIDFDEKVVRVGRTLNLIAGDGETNVLHLNSVDWNDGQIKQMITIGEIYIQKV